jgi:hypothetical protein
MIVFSMKPRMANPLMFLNPELGCVSQGDTPDEAVHNLTEAREIISLFTGRWA